MYKGLKVMPVSTGCATTLANFEAGQNYKVTAFAFLLCHKMEDGSEVDGGLEMRAAVWYSLCSMCKLTSACILIWWLLLKAHHG